jgi:hypothetical protein
VADGPVTNSAGSSGSVIDLNLVARPLHGSDFDSDGDTDGEDLLTWQDGFGITTGATRTDGDADNDGQVDGDDLSLWQTQYSTVPPGAFAAALAVPEPGVLAIALTGMAVIGVSTGRCQRGSAPSRRA